MDILKFVDSMASKGRYHFTTVEAAEAVGSSYVAARAAIKRLRMKGSVAMPFQGFNVIVPPEYRRLGCLPPEQFVPQLMEHLGLDYYVALLSAAQIHGAAHQRPQMFQVIVAGNRSQIVCGGVRVQFVARHNVGDVPTVTRNTPRGFVKVASVEASALDLIGYVYRCGGLDNVATVLAELAEAVNAEDLARAASLSPIPWAQRLGYLFEFVDAGSITGPLAVHVAQSAREYVPLNPKRGVDGKKRSSRWKLVINERVEPDL